MTQPLTPIRLAAGATVTFGRGTFNGFSGTVTEDWPGHGTVSVAVTIFGREVRLTVAPHDLTPSPLPRVAEWPEETSLALMFENIFCHASERKATLFRLACCRRLSHLMTEPRGAALCAEATSLGRWEIHNREPVAADFLLRTLEAVERFAETGEGKDVLEQANVAAWTLYSALDQYHQHIDEGWRTCDQELLATAGAAHAVEELCNRHALDAAIASSRAAYWSAGGTDPDGLDAEEEAAQRALARDIFGIPLHLESAPAAWLTPEVLGIAQTLYDEWPDGLMPILADALEDAGCADPAILAHCRDGGPHVKGCWVVDLLLGKS